MPPMQHARTVSGGMIQVALHAEAVLSRMSVTAHAAVAVRYCTLGIIADYQLQIRWLRRVLR